MPATRATQTPWSIFIIIPSLITESIYSCLFLPENRADKIQESHRVGVRQTQQQTLLVELSFLPAKGPEEKGNKTTHIC